MIIIFFSEFDERLEHEKMQPETIKAFEDNNEGINKDIVNDAKSKKFNIEGQKVELKDIHHEIFGCSNKDFDFKEFNLDTLKEQLESFKEKNWSKLNEAEKTDIVNGFVKSLGQTIDLTLNLRVEWFKGDLCDCGCYVRRKNKICINVNWIHDSSMILDTVAHEVWHAKQYECSKNPMARKDYLYAVNFSPKVYYLPRKVDGNYVGFNIYEGQLVEAEAMAFADKIVKGVEDSGRD